MTYARLSLTTPALFWGLIASIAGLLIVTLPLGMSVMLVGGIGLLAVFWLEPPLALVVMLAVAPLKNLVETETALALPVDVGQLLFFVAVSMWGMRKILQHAPFWKGRADILFVPTVLFLGVTGLTLPMAYSVTTGITEWLKWVEIFILMWITADLKNGRWMWLLFGVVLAAAIHALVGLYTFLGGSGAPHLWILNYQYFRAFGTFGQPNPFGAFMGLVLLLALGTTWGYITAVWQKPIKADGSEWAMIALYGGLSGVIVLGLIASWSRGAWMGFGAGTLMMVWLAPRRLAIGTLWLGGVLVMGAVLWSAGLLPTALTSRILSFTEDFTGFRDMRGVVITDENFAVVERLAHWQAALDMAATRPWFGVGFGNYEAAYDNFALVNWPVALGHAHNYYLNLLAETGVIGLSVYLILWLTIFMVNWKTLRYSQGIQRGIALGLMGAWTHIMVHSLVDKIYVNNLFLHIGVMLGILVVLHQHQHNTN